MVIGVPKEIKDHETRVGLVPAGVTALREAGHEVLVEAGAGDGSAIPDIDYQLAGAVVLDSAADVWDQADIIVKVKEPQASETAYFRPGLVLFTYLHLAPLPELTQKLLDAKVTAIAYETIRDETGALPLLIPMSEVAGRLSVQLGAQYLEKYTKGRGVLLGGVPGVAPAEVVIIGGGIVGSNAARVAIGTGARVTIIDKNLHRLRELDDTFLGKITTLAANSTNIAQALAKADLVIGAVLVPGAAAPKVIRREMLRGMKKGAVFADVAIDQGGCAETSRPTSHSEPVYEVEGVIHYCVPNIPALVPNTSTLALTNATLPYLLQLADKGIEKALTENSALREGVNTYQGAVTCQAVAESQGREWHGLQLK
jgi:alanine dehydrogenase